MFATRKKTILILGFIFISAWAIVNSIIKEKAIGEILKQDVNRQLKNVTTGFAMDEIKGSFGTFKKTAFVQDDFSEKKQKSSKSSQPEKKDLVDNIFDVFNKAAKGVDDVGQNLLGLTIEEELRLGKDAHTEISKGLKFVNDDIVLSKIKILSKPILDLRFRKGITYKIFVVKNNEVNAFAHIGGYIYINQGLIDYFTADEELQFVLGHEIAHVDLNHCAKKIAYAVRAGQVIGEIGQNITSLAYETISLGYSKEDEFEADQKSFDWLIKNKLSREKALSGARKLVILSSRNDQNRVPGKVEQRDIFGKINDHFSTHPPALERLNRLEKIKSGS